MLVILEQILNHLKSQAMSCGPADTTPLLWNPEHPLAKILLLYTLGFLCDIGQLASIAKAGITLAH